MVYAAAARMRALLGRRIIIMHERSPSSVGKPIRVALVSRYEIVQESLKLLVDSSRGLSVTGTYSLASDLDELTALEPADVAVIYISAGDGVEVISVLRRLLPDVRVTVIIGSADLDAQAEALKLGAVGIVHKEQSPRLLIEAIRKTFQGETWLNQVLLNKLLEKGKPQEKSTKQRFQIDVDSLTAREIEVVKMIGEGLKNKSIATRLSISEATVRHHLSSIYGKVGVEDRLNLVIFAYQKGIIKLSDSPGAIAAGPAEGAQI